MSLNREKIDKFVGMLGVDNDGERANAARFLHKFALENKMTMVEMFSKVYGGGGERIVYVEKIVEKPVYRDRPGSSGTAGPKPQKEDLYEEVIRRGREANAKTNLHERAAANKAYGHNSLLGKLSTLLAYHTPKLDQWEKDFVDSIKLKVAQGLDLTPKQRVSLNKIFTKVGM